MCQQALRDGTLQQNVEDNTNITCSILVTALSLLFCVNQTQAKLKDCNSLRVIFSCWIASHIIEEFYLLGHNATSCVEKSTNAYEEHVASAFRVKKSAKQESSMKKATDRLIRERVASIFRAEESARIQHEQSRVWLTARLSFNSTQWRRIGDWKHSSTYSMALAGDRWIASCPGLLIPEKDPLISIG
jgi:hypothetical protein